MANKGDPFYVKKIILKDGGVVEREDGTNILSVPTAGTSQTFAQLSAAHLTTATVATTGNTDGYIVVPATGVISSVDFSGVDALATNDSNYITFSITNLGQAGAGSTAVLAATDANTTKATGGTALAANTKRTLTLSSTTASLSVTAGDRLRIRAAATGTLANTVTFPAYVVRFGITA